MMSDPTPESAPKSGRKVRRARQACFECKRRKVRCDMRPEIPCSNCRAKRIECRVVTDNRRNRPRLLVSDHWGSIQNMFVDGCHEEVSAFKNEILRVFPVISQGKMDRLLERCKSHQECSTLEKLVHFFLIKLGDLILGTEEDIVGSMSFATARVQLDLQLERETTYVQAQILVALILSYSGLAMDHNLEMAVKAVRTGYDMQEDDQDCDFEVSLTTLTTCYLFCENPTLARLTTIVDLLGTIELPSESDLLLSFGSNFACFEYHYLHYLCGLWGLLQPFECARLMETFAPQIQSRGEQLRNSAEDRILKYVNLQVWAADAFVWATSDSRVSDTELGRVAMIEFVKIAQTFSKSDRLRISRQEAYFLVRLAPNINRDNWKLLSHDTLVFLQDIQPQETELQLLFNMLQAIHQSDMYAGDSTQPP